LDARPPGVCLGDLPGVIGKAWLLLAAAAIAGAGAAFTEAGVHGVVTAPGSVPGAAYLAAIGPGLQAAGMLIAVVAVPAVCPDGRLPGPRAGWPGAPPRP